MTTVKVRFRRTMALDEPGTVYYQLTQDKKKCSVETDIHILPEFWDAKNETITPPLFENEMFLLEYKKKVETGLLQIKRIIKELERRGKPYEIRDIATAYERMVKRESVMALFQMEIAQCKKMKKMGTMRSYTSTYNSFSRFMAGRDIPLFLINTELLLDYETWLRSNGCVRNTSSFYMRNLRSIYNKAVKNRMIEQKSPFKSVYTGIDKTRKRAIDEKTIMRMQNLMFKRKYSLEFSRDLFLFSFFTRGMAFVDMFFLKKEDIGKDIISYVRHKTDQRLIIRIEPCISNIINKYKKSTADSPYVFPLINMNSPKDIYKQYRNALNIYNKNLKKLCIRLHLKLELTSYTARHSWATTARKHKIPLSVISAGMGHTSERTTQIYLESIDNSVIDAANQSLLKNFNNKKKNWIRLQDD